MALVRLAGLCFLVGLTTSRVTLLVHEFVGHGAVAAALGAEVDGYWLFVFGGGYVSFLHGDWEPWRRLTSYLGGIALELIAGGALLWWAHRRGLARRAVPRFALLGFAAINLIHGAFYLATGTHHGFGDGWYLHHLLGAARRWWLVVPAVAATVGCAFVAARLLAGAARGWLPGSTTTRRTAGLIVAVGFAGAGHAALTFGELSLFPRAEYRAVMIPEQERIVRRELEQYVAQEGQERGAPPPAVEIERERQVLIARHRTFPLLPLLIVAVALAGVAGIIVAVRRRPQGVAAEAAALTWRDLTDIATACVGSVVLVALLRVLS